MGILGRLGWQEQMARPASTSFSCLADVGRFTHIRDVSVRIVLSGLTIYRLL